VNKPFSWLRAWFVPIGLVLLAGLLTVPWSYLVLRAAYDRDVTENARQLAHRVEIQRQMTYADAGGPLDLVFPLREEARKRQMAGALATEIGSDPSVQTLIFYNIIYQQNTAPNPPTPALAEFLAIIKREGSVVEKLSVDDVVMLRDTDRATTGEFRARCSAARPALHNPMLSRIR